MDYIQILNYVPRRDSLVIIHFDIRVIYSIVIVAVDSKVPSVNVNCSFKATNTGWMYSILLDFTGFYSILLDSREIQSGYYTTIYPVPSHPTQNVTDTARSRAFRRGQCQEHLSGCQPHAQPHAQATYSHGRGHRHLFRCTVQSLTLPTARPIKHCPQQLIKKVYVDLTTSLHLLYLLTTLFLYQESS